MSTSGDAGREGGAEIDGARGGSDAPAGDAATPVRVLPAPSRPRARRWEWGRLDAPAWAWVWLVLACAALGAAVGLLQWATEASRARRAALREAGVEPRGLDCCAAPAPPRDGEPEESAEPAEPEQCVEGRCPPACCSKKGKDCRCLSIHGRCRCEPLPPPDALEDEDG